MYERICGFSFERDESYSNLQQVDLPRMPMSRFLFTEAFQTQCLFEHTESVSDRPNRSDFGSIGSHLTVKYVNRKNKCPDVMAHSRASASRCFAALSVFRLR